MSDKSSIEWTQATLNPWTGCRKVDPACAYCYISRTPPFRIAGRQFVKGSIPLVFHMERLDRMVRRRVPTLYFVNSLSDLFHEDASDDQIAQVFGAMAAAPQHTFQCLTKREDRMVELLRRTEFVEAVEGHVSSYGRQSFGGLPWPLPNVWMGVTIGLRRFVGRADVLRRTPAAVRFISAEPLLGPLVHDESASHASEGIYSCWSDGYRGPELDLTDIDWLIVGGESGGPPHRALVDDRGVLRTSRVRWVRDLRDATRCGRCWEGAIMVPNGCFSSAPEACPDCGGMGYRTAFFFKQLGGARAGAALEDLPGDLQIREMPYARR